MSKIDIDEVEAVLLQHKVADAPAIITDLEKILEELKAEREAEAGDKPKYDFVVILNDPNGVLGEFKNNVENDVSAYVVQQEEGDDAGTILSRIGDAANNQNAVTKRKKNHLQTTLDIFSGLKSKYLKEKKLKIKTKEPVRVLLGTGKL